MSRHIDDRLLVATVALWIVGTVLFIALSNSFGGPRIDPFGRPYEVSATIEDAQGLLKKSLVLTRGVRVGEVSARRLDGNRVRFTMALDRRYAPIFRDATVSLRRRTLFGEAYVALDRGTQRAGELAEGATLDPARVLPTVELDEALAALDAPTRAHLSSLGRTGAEVDETPAAAERFNATVEGFGDVLDELREVGELLDGQRTDLTRFVADGRDVLAELGAREQEIRSLVSGGRATTEAFAAQQAPLGEGLEELPMLLRAARLTLRESHPLLTQARPVVGRLADAAPRMTTAFKELPAVSRSARTTLQALPGLRRAAVPLLDRLAPVTAALDPALKEMEPVLRNLVPIIDYTAPYRREIVGWIGGAGAGVQRLRPDGTVEHPDRSVQKLDPEVGWSEDNVLYGRFLIENVQSYALDQPDADTKSNPYPAPGDAFSPYEPGTYPRLEPFPLRP